ncbi:MAG: SpoIIIAH-like family protein [Clostridia bacterium]|nr:SpoIIIAH-like family protein [Clostridia bacterium]
MLGKKKKIIILTGMVALLVLTGVLNVVLNMTASNPSSDVNAGTTYTDFFSAYRTDRTSSREQSMLYYDEIIASTESSAEAKSEAETAKLSLTASMETELVLESLIKSLGFEDAVVTSTTENINVIVKCDEMTGTQAAQILEIIVTETETNATNVRIIPTE